MNLFLMNTSPKNYGATQRIVDLIAQEGSIKFEQVNKCCLGEIEISYCKGCKSCYTAGECVIHDGMNEVIDAMKAADVLVIVAPSYWGDIPGQFKVFIDRCTSYNVARSLAGNRKCFAVALREGQRSFECEHIIECITHWCGHMEVEMCGSSYYCGIHGKEDVEKYADTIKCMAKKWFESI